MVETALIPSDLSGTFFVLASIALFFLPALAEIGGAI